MLLNVVIFGVMMLCALPDDRPFFQEKVKKIIKLKGQIESIKKSKIRLHKSMEGMVLIPELENKVAYILEGARIMLALPPLRKCNRCGIEKEEWHFEKYVRWCTPCREIASEEFRQRRVIYSRVYRCTPEYRAIRRIQIKERSNADPQFALARKIRGIIYRAFRNRGITKGTKTNDIIGCSFEQLKKHFEKLFAPGMDWNNHGQWHIDHKIPLATAKNEEELIRLNHYSNLQPLWAIENLRKGSRI